MSSPDATLREITSLDWRKRTVEISSHKHLMVFSGSSNESLAREVANILGTDLGGVERSVFANGEI